MNNTTLKILWAGMFVLCACLGFLSEAEGFLKWLLVAISLLFFVPPGLLLYNSWQTHDKKELAFLRNLSALWLGVTLVLMVSNLLSALAPQLVGDILYFLLVVFATPMMCSQYWFIAPFLWAVLLFASLEALKEGKKS